MMLTLTIPDELWATYGSSRQRIVQQLERFKGIEANERILVLSGPALAKVEGTFNKVGITPDELAANVTSLSSVKIDDVAINLRHGQRRLIEGEAKHYKESFEERAAKVLRRALDEVLGVY